MIGLNSSRELATSNESVLFQSGVATLLSNLFMRLAQSLEDYLSGIGIRVSFIRLQVVLRSRHTYS